MTPDRIPVENERMVRDRRTGALLSTDRDAIRAYEARKRERQSQAERINNLEQTVAELQKAISEIIGKR
jgi:hypothetical protein